MPYFFWDSTLLILIPGILLALFAQSYVSSTYRKYSAVATHGGLPAHTVARRILDDAGLHGVQVEPTAGHLTDHYDPRARVLRLSEGVYGSSSISALGIAAHEAGHAIQHGKGYACLKVRNAIFPVVRIASSLAIPLLLAGLLLEVAALYDVALILYATAIVFQLITLPVEFNASRRATDILAAEGYLDYGEVQGAQKVLRAAALTYIASFLLSLLQFLRLLAITGSRRD